MPMISVKGAVKINASPEQVFALITDVWQCAELDAQITVLDISVRPEGAMREGSMIHYRVATEGHIREYQSQVVAA
jgi:uncharacterized protein YndB with AHSA1/START domain